MESTTLLRDLTILFGSAVLISWLFRLVRLSTITGFIVAGALVGPFGLGLITSGEDVRHMEEIGVILLLFSIGIEFSPDRIRNMRRAAMLGGGLQVLLTGLAVALLSWLAGADVRTGILLGMLVSLSSTVIGLRLLAERGQTMSPEGGVSLAVLIFQDIAVLPMILFLPLLTGDMAPEPAALAGTLLFSGGAVVLILLVARGLVPRLIAATVRVRSRDLFILSVILAVTGIAWVSTVVGISGGLGAFLAGLAISKSAYSHQVLSDILPFRETFNSLFFVSIGMLLDPAFLFARAPEILALGLGVLVLKSGVTSGVVRLLGYPWRIALGVGLLLSQVGEFAIVLLRSGAGDALGVEGGQMVLATILVTMILSPLPVRLLEWFQPAAGRPESGASPGLSDHTLIIGYGLNGRNVASLLAASGFPFAVLEMNPETVGRARKEGTPIFYGDASSESVLEWVGVRDARAVVVAISDPAATRTTVALARQLNPDAFVVARTRYLPEIEPLYEAGASSVITEEFETSLTLIRRLLDRLGVHPSKIDRTVLDIRQRHYRAFRGAPPPVLEVDQAMRMFETTAGEGSAGRTIGDLGLRSRAGATIVAVERKGRLVPNPQPDFVLETGDRLHLIGSEQEVGAAIALI